MRKSAKKLTHEERITCLECKLDAMMALLVNLSTKNPSVDEECSYVEPENLGNATTGRGRGISFGGFMRDARTNGVDPLNPTPLRVVGCGTNKGFSGLREKNYDSVDENKKFRRCLVDWSTMGIGETVKSRERRTEEIGGRHLQIENQGDQITNALVSAFRTVGQEVKLHIPEFDGRGECPNLRKPMALLSQHLHDHIDAALEQLLSEDYSDAETKLPVGDITKALEKKGYEVMESHDAGRFVCNYVYYHSLRFSEEHKIKSLFVHVPLFSTIDEDTQMQFAATLLEVLASVS
ncbi:hypothetical protein GIB67_011283 [Kingdonia uniflora]|uniref:Uncharacterized protein n=1 Tax=Kingdonia uniflora TaxID=39325 RepID=A0A7J7MNZ8_9MAGN|nr:hypothetical protein GIB67_011283 [Kingdonia uniflora]